MLPSEQVVQNILSITLYIGGPIIPLMVLAVMIGNWHRVNRDPKDGVKGEESASNGEESAEEEQAVEPTPSDAAAPLA